MVRAVEAAWLQERLGTEPRLTVIDPRPRPRYLSGHVPDALSVPAEALFTPEGRLLPDDELAALLGSHGVPGKDAVVIYADGDGQAGAMLAWILEYLGHPDVRFLCTRFERWKEQGGRLAYRLVTPFPTSFEPQVRQELRATRESVGRGDARLLDTRTPEEFSGDRVLGDEPPGHIPSARNLSHTSFLGEGHDLLASQDHLSARLTGVGIDPQQATIAYCRSGLRASVAWLALHLAGCPVSLYDGSFLDWTSDPAAPVELDQRECEG